eukprot:TRINITY_DN13443_c0_g1_i1.p2 TRINITY_DN13443_c0_g1~~TRINITY_DN13443_c0_g1_i1.p2  ORF type:complete len:51 (-),score=0.63 TRINITY_DN13443_c0_g1_i1:20-172(-)
MHSKNKKKQKRHPHIYHYHVESYCNHSTQNAKPMKSPSKKQMLKTSRVEG